METYLNTIDIITIITSVATLIALGFTIYQAYLTKSALLETKKPAKFLPGCKAVLPALGGQGAASGCFARSSRDK